MDFTEWNANPDNVNTFIKVYTNPPVFRNSHWIFKANTNHNHKATNNRYAHLD
jgi:hypothetical protein